MRALKPYVEEVIEQMFLEIANKITKNFTLDELFPEDQNSETSGVVLKLFKAFKL